MSDIYATCITNAIVETALECAETGLQLAAGGPEATPALIAEWLANATYHLGTMRYALYEGQDKVKFSEREIEEIMGSYAALWVTVVGHEDE
jgi:hypothetical protein